MSLSKKIIENTVYKHGMDWKSQNLVMPSLHLSEMCSNHTRRWNVSHIYQICVIFQSGKESTDNIWKEEASSKQNSEGDCLSHINASQISLLPVMWVGEVSYWWLGWHQTQVTATSQATSPQPRLIKLVRETSNKQEKKTFVPLFAFLIMRKCSVFINNERVDNAVSMLQPCL